MCVHMSDMSRPTHNCGARQRHRPAVASFLIVYGRSLVADASVTGPAQLRGDAHGAGTRRGWRIRHDRELAQHVAATPTTAVRGAPPRRTAAADPRAVRRLGTRRELAPPPKRDLGSCGDVQVNS